MSLLSLLTNLMHSGWIKVLISFKNKSYRPQTFTPKRYALNIYILYLEKIYELLYIQIISS